MALNPTTSASLGLRGSAKSVERRWLNKVNGLAFLDFSIDNVPPEGDYVPKAQLGIKRVVGIISSELVARQGPTLIGTRARGLVNITGATDDGGTITIDGRIYTWETGAIDTAYKLNVGADQAASVVVLQKAINGTGTAGTDYGTGTLRHPSVFAEATANDEFLWILARTPGLAGNGIPLIETSANLTVSAATLTGGKPPVVASRRGEWARAFANTQTESIVEDDVGDIFLKHSESDNRTIRCTALVVVTGFNSYD